MRSQEEREQRRARWYAQRREAAPDAASEARVAWDQVRGVITSVPTDRREAAWVLLLRALDGVITTIEERK